MILCMSKLVQGLVQGSLIGPVLYLLFTNDFASNINDSVTVMYADDVQFMHSNLPGDIVAMKERVSKTLEEAHCWFVANSLKINPSKTELLLLRTRQRHLSGDLSITFNDTVLSSSSSAKILGIVLDDNLSWKARTRISCCETLLCNTTWTF